MDVKIDIQTIILSRVDAIGDVILTLPLAGLLKQHYPKARILFLGRTYTQALVDVYPYIDGFINWDTLEAFSKEEAIQELKSYNANVFIHVYPKRKIAYLAKDAEIPIRIGTSHRWYNWFTCTEHLNFSRKNSDLHESCLNTLLLKPLGIIPVKNKEDLLPFVRFENVEERTEHTKLLSPFLFNVILHPKSKGSAREWGVDKFAELIELLPTNKFRIFITGTDEEAVFMQKEIIDKYTNRIINLCGKTSLPELIQLLSQADAVVAASTGPLHIGAFAGTHALGIYPPIRPMHPGRWAPLGKRTKTFVTDHDCDFCKSGNHCLCIESILPEEVASYLASLDKFEQYREK